MSYVTVSRHDAVTLLTLERPPANAMDIGLLQEIVAAVDQLAAAPPPALVITGTDSCFSSGADLKAVPGYGPEEQRAAVQGIIDMAIGVYALPFPVIGAINGHAIAGGMVLALCTDVRIASRAGRYGLTEVKVGVPYPRTAIGVVQAELSPSAARFLALGSELTDAQTCRELGAFDEVREPDEVLPRALEVAEQLAAMPAAVYARTKAALRGKTIVRLRATALTDPLLEGWVG